MDPEDSFSDYTIVIEGEASHVKARYHVHKVQLLHGQFGECEYFLGPLRRGEAGFAGDKSEITIKFDDDAARAFPDFLDLIYTGKVSNLSAENAVLLLHLADYFGVSHLVAFASDHLNKMSIENLLRECLPYIIMFQQDDSVEAIFYRTVLRSADTMLSSSRSDMFRLFSCMNATFLTEVLKICEELMAGCRVIGLKVERPLPIIDVVYNFIADGFRFLSWNDFETLTSVEVLPQIPTSEDALNFLFADICFALQGELCDEPGETGATAKSLVQRCLNVLVEEGVKDVRRANDAFTKLSSRYNLPEIFALSLDRSTDSTTNGTFAGLYYVEALSCNRQICGSYRKTTVVYRGNSKKCFKMSGLNKGQPCDYCIIKHRRNKWEFERYCKVTNEWYSMFVNSQKSVHPPSWGWHPVASPADPSPGGLKPVLLLAFKKAEDSQE